MAEKSKLKWLRKEFGSSEELEYYLSQLKHQDKLKSDIISLLQRFQHLLFTSYEPDFLTITYNGQWDVSFGPVVSEPPLAPLTEPTSVATGEPAAKAPAKRKTKSTAAPPETGKSKTSRPAKKAPPATSPVKPPAPIDISTRRIDLKALLQAELLAAGARLKHKTQPSIVATVTREGHLKIGKNEYQSLSGAATSFASSGRRDGWLCWLFQDEDGEWKPIDQLRERWRDRQADSSEKSSSRAE